MRPSLEKSQSLCLRRTSSALNQVTVALRPVTGNISAYSDVDKDDEVVDTVEEVDNQPLISTEFIEERTAAVVYANVNIVSDYTLNEEMLGSSIAATCKEKRRIAARMIPPMITELHFKRSVWLVYAEPQTRMILDNMIMNLTSSKLKSLQRICRCPLTAIIPCLYQLDNIVSKSS